jgi:hypothetical protein
MVVKLKKLLVKNVINAVKTDISQALIKKVMNQFQVELIGKVDLSDPAAPEHFEGDFLEILTETVNSSMVVTQDSISFSLRDNSKLGYDGDISRPVDTMVFLLEGILGEYAFLTPKMYGKHMHTRGKPVGRWGKGALMMKERFFEDGWDKTFSWSEARWGFSNTGPINIFEIDDSVVGDIIDETIKKTIKEFASQLRAEHGKK